MLAGVKKNHGSFLFGISYLVFKIIGGQEGYIFTVISFPHSGILTFLDMQDQL
jgi:hypothetical protein